MESHPPLGKLLIAAGEFLFGSGPYQGFSIDHDFAASFPDGVSFKGYRFFPALFAWLGGVLFFMILHSLVGSPLIAFFGSFMFIFQNALIVHFRGAMIDSILIFFMLSCFYFSLKAFQLGESRKRLIAFFIFGISLGCGYGTKFLGLISFLFLLPHLKYLYLNWRKACLSLVAIGIGFAISWLSIWQIHISLGRHLHPALEGEGYYQASEETKNHLINDEYFGPKVLFHHIRDAMRYANGYHDKVPDLDLCKKEENGSLPWMWLLGGRSINYRWDKGADGLTRYLYLQVNPIAWYLSTFGILILIFALWQKRKSLSFDQLLWGVTLIGTFVAFYGAVSLIPRVMYLYHAFIPYLIGSLALFYAFHLSPLKVKFQALLSFLILLGFWFYRPLTYHQPVSSEWVQRRAIFSIFDLRPHDVDSNEFYRSFCASFK